MYVFLNSLQRYNKVLKWGNYFNILYEYNMHNRLQKYHFIQG